MMTFRLRSRFHERKQHLRKFATKGFIKNLASLKRIARRVDREIYQGFVEGRRNSRRWEFALERRVP